MARQDSVVDAAEALRALLPATWTVSLSRPSKSGTDIRLTTPSGAVVGFTATMPKDVSPRAIATLDPPSSPTLVVADWISRRSRDLLRAIGASYLDATGNAEIRLDEPAVYVRTDGASRNPSPKAAAPSRLRGPKAWAILRTLAEAPPPFGVRELAAAVDVDPGYVSRVLRALEDEVLITRTPRGPVTDVEWEGVIRKSASTYSLFDSNETSTWVASSGPDRFIDDLATARAGEWAVTGSFAATRLAPVAAAETAVIYCTDPDRIARAGRLLSTTRGANVVLAVPYDPVVFEATSDSDAVRYVSPAQVAIDSLTGNARMPAEGEAILGWMRKNEPRWRTRALTPRGRKQSA